MSFKIQKKLDFDIKGLYDLKDKYYQSVKSTPSLKNSNYDTQESTWNPSSTDTYRKYISKYIDTNIVHEYIDVDKKDFYNTSFLTRLNKYYSTKNITSSTVDDTQKQTEKTIQKEFEEKLLFYFQNEEIGLGTYTEADKLLESYLNDFNNLTQGMISNIFRKNIKEPEILCKLLLLISRLNPSKIDQTGHVIAMAALNHNNNDVKEYAIRVFENFSDESSLEFLEESKQDVFWLQEYKEEIIQELKEKFNS